MVLRFRQGEYKMSLEQLQGPQVKGMLKERGDLCQKNASVHIKNPSVEKAGTIPPNKGSKNED